MKFNYRSKELFHEVEVAIDVEEALNEIGEDYIVSIVNKDLLLDAIGKDYCINYFNIKEQD